MDQLRGIGLKVFYTILKQHRVKLPQSMREFGDSYVKEEFRQANEKANQEQYIEFLQRWAMYIEELALQKDVGRNLTFEEQLYLNEEQTLNLEKIKNSTK